jgi:hypothetical protein
MRKGLGQNWLVSNIGLGLRRPNFFDFCRNSANRVPGRDSNWGQTLRQAGVQTNHI